MNGPSVKVLLAPSPAERTGALPLEVTLRLDRAGWTELVARIEAALDTAGPDEIVDVVVRGYSR